MTIVSVNKMSDELSLELKGNLVRVCACVFSALVAVGFIAKSTPLQWNYIVAVTPAKAQGFYQLSFTQEKLDTGSKATTAWHRTKA